MKIFVRPCELAELSFVIESIDREFIFNKGRKFSFSCRFPNVVSQENVRQIQVAVLDRSICGVVAIRAFDYLAGMCVWRGAMIGMVWVDPQYRGRGVGKEIMNAVKSNLQENHCDFGVLWTGNPAIYEKHGWFISDKSLYAEIHGICVSCKTEEVICQPLDSIDAMYLEKIRTFTEPLRVVRSPLDYQVKPIPADDIDCFFASTDEGNGYALVGKLDKCGFFYEMDAPPILWDMIWGAIIMHYEKLIINGREGDPFSKWLSDKQQVKWQRQQKNMWLRISQRATDLPYGTWHIPYFDRI